MLRKGLFFFFSVLFLFSASLVMAQDNGEEGSALPNRTTKSGFYFEGLIGAGILDFDGMDLGEDARIKTVSGLAYGIKVGHKFYFGDDSKKFRIGLDANWFSWQVSRIRDVLIVQTQGVNVPSQESFNTDYMNFSLLNPGVSISVALGDEVGLDANFNFGPNFSMLFEPGWSPGDLVGIGFRMAPQVKFHYRLLSIGLEYSNMRVPQEESEWVNSNWNGLKNRIFGLNIGMKF